MDTSIDTNLPALIERLRRAATQAPAALTPVQAEAEKKLLRHARDIAPYRTGALHDSLHPVGPKRSGTRLESSIEPGPEIFYSIFLVKKGGRLDWVERTVEERPDLPQRLGQEGAAAIADALNGDS